MIHDVDIPTNMKRSKMETAVTAKYRSVLRRVLFLCGVDNRLGHAAVECEAKKLGLDVRPKNRLHTKRAMPKKRLAGAGQIMVVPRCKRKN